MADKTTWEQLAYWLSPEAPCPVAISIVHDDAGDWSVAVQFGREAEDSPMAGGALYGYGATAEAAVQEALDDLSPHSRGLR